MIRPGELSTPEDGLTIEQRFGIEVRWFNLLRGLAQQEGVRVLTPDPDPFSILRQEEEGDRP